MPPPSNNQDDWNILKKRIIGFGEQSARKSYYPELQKRLQELEKIQEQLHEKNFMLEEEIAERQRAEEALAAKQHELELVNASLEERIAVTVSELRQRDELLLYQSRLAAMGELLQNIAHQWRQPLNNVAAYLQNIQFFKSRGELSDEEMNHDINSVLSILQYMSKTIDDFRNFFRGDCSVKQFTLGAVAEQVLNLVRSGLDSAYIKISLSEAGSPKAKGQQNEFTQALMNIINNAKDILIERSVPEPLITISIQTDGDFAVLEVHDNGGGITEDILPHIFEPYFTTKGPAHGTGIGLYMSKMIIERNMGGSLTVANRAAGATFIIKLPLSLDVQEIIEL